MSVIWGAGEEGRRVFDLGLSNQSESINQRGERIARNVRGQVNFGADLAREKLLAVLGSLLLRVLLPPGLFLEVYFSFGPGTNAMKS